MRKHNSDRAQRKDLTRAAAIAALVAAAFALSGCGAAYREPLVDTAGGGSSSGGGGSTEPPTVDLPFEPTYTYSFEVSGTGGLQPTETVGPITVDSDLRVRITPGPAGNLMLPGGGYSNYNANYGCVRYTIGIKGQTGKVQTKPLKIPGVTPTTDECKNAVESDTIDLSAKLTAGTEAVELVVSNPRTDYWCRLWWMCYANPYGLYGGCMSLLQGSGYNPQLYCTSLRTTYQNHTVTGSLEAATEGADL